MHNPSVHGQSYNQKTAFESSSHTRFWKRQKFDDRTWVVKRGPETKNSGPDSIGREDRYDADYNCGNPSSHQAESWRGLDRDGRMFLQVKRSPADCGSHCDCIESNRRLLKLDSAEKLSEFCLENVQNFDAVNVATAFHRLAKLETETIHGRPKFDSRCKKSNIRLEQAVRVLQKQALASAWRFKPQELGNVMWAHATLAMEPGAELEDALSKRAVDISHDFKPLDVSILMWAMATMRIEPGVKLERAMLRRAEATARRFRPKEIANLMWALATLGLEPGSALTRAVLKQAVETMDRFNPQDVANLMWSLASIGIEPGSELVRVISKRAVATAEGFTEQQVANLMWALATLGLRPRDELLRAMSRQAVATALCFTPQGVANLMWALAIMNVEPGSELLRKMLKQTAARAEQFNPQHIANLMWALATLSIEPCAELLGTISRQAVASAGQFDSQNIANLMWALVTLRTEPTEELMEAMLRQSVAISRQFRPQDVSNLMWALAALGVTPTEELATAMAQRTIAVAGSFSPKDAAGVLWALAALGLGPGRSCQAEWEAAAAALAPAVSASALRRAWPSLDERKQDCASTLCQLHQVLLCAELDGFLPTLDLPQRLGSELAGLCRRAFERSPATRSQLQASVARALTAAGVAFDEEVTEPRTGYKVDMLVRDDGPGRVQGIAAERRGRFLVEVDGPRHFVGLMDKGRRRSLATVLKRRLLERAGWRVVDVPFWEWDALAGPAEQAEYLQRRLRE